MYADRTSPPSSRGWGVVKNAGFFILRWEAGAGIDGLEALRRANFELLLDRLENQGSIRGKRLLEVGSARGWFLEAAGKRGADVRGIEPEAENARVAQDHGLSVETGLFPQDLEDRGPYDLIVFNDVFEHIPQPSNLIGEVADLLSPGGL